MDEQPELAQAFLDARAGQAYRAYLKMFSQKTVNVALILGYLSEGIHETHPNKIADDLFITSSQMAVLLNHMEEMGLICRLPDPLDHRKTIVQLTEKGAEYHNQLLTRYKSFVGEIFERMGEESSKQFVELFSRFIGLGAQVYSERKRSD